MYHKRNAYYLQCYNILKNISKKKIIPSFLGTLMVKFLFIKKGLIKMRLNVFNMFLTINNLLQLLLQWIN